MKQVGIVFGFALALVASSATAQERPSTTTGTAEAAPTLTGWEYRCLTTSYKASSCGYVLAPLASGETRSALPPAGPGYEYRCSTSVFGGTSCGIVAKVAVVPDVPPVCNAENHDLLEYQSVEVVSVQSGRTNRFVLPEGDSAAFYNFWFVTGLAASCSDAKMSLYVTVLSQNSESIVFRASTNLKAEDFVITRTELARSPRLQYFIQQSIGSNPRIAPKLVVIHNELGPFDSSGL